MSTLAQLFDPSAFAIVIAGTALATAARAGWTDLKAAGGAFVRLGGSSFDADANRVALARTASAVDRDGPLCADVPMPPDPSLARAIKAFIRHTSLDAFHQVRRAERAMREAKRAQAVRTFEYAGELAPVFGLVGTLFAITQMVSDAGGAAQGTLAAIGTAVLSTLYGVLVAHLVCLPIGQAIERKGEREEAEREHLSNWIDQHLRAEPDSNANRIVPVPRIRDVA
ncbi:MAG: MotA/TolQ/ExbB proton channel family protein [Pseudomonadota bacterium]